MIFESIIFDVGRLCIKLAGRDAGRSCVVVEVIDPNYVLVDGATRRKKVNVRHLEPLAQTIDLKEKASHVEVGKAFEKLGLKVWNTKKKEVVAKPQKIRIKKEKPVKEKTAEPKTLAEEKKEDKMKE